MQLKSSLKRQKYLLSGVNVMQKTGCHLLMCVPPAVYCIPVSYTPIIN